MEKSVVTKEWMKVAEVELVYKQKIRPSERPQIITSADAFKLFLASWNLNKIELVEQFKVMPLNNAHRVLGICELSTGSITGTVVDPRLLFALLLKAGASAAIICHCHPGGNVKPSHADETLTEKIVAGGKLLDIKILDHLIITAENYYSFADNGAM